MEANANILQTLKASTVVAMRNRFGYIPVWLWLLQIVLTSFFSMYFFAVLADYANNPTANVQYVVIGNMVQSIAMSTLYSVAEIPGTEKHTGTLPTLMSTSSSLFNIMFGMALFNIFAGIVSASFSILYAAFVFGIDFSGTNAISLIVIIALTIFSLTGMGMAIGGIGLRLRTSSIIASLVTYLGLVLCGVNFPISYLPEWLQYVSWCLPLTYSVDATRGAVAGSSLAGVSLDIWMMAVLGIVYLALAYLLFSMFENGSRKKGSLDSF
jgi:ABC-2 type transport system permease protein